MRVDEEARHWARVLWEFHTAPARPDGPEPAAPADLVLGLGSHDLRVAGYAAELWLAGVAPKVLFTGNRGRRTAGGDGFRRWDRPEAEEFAAVARDRGVPDGALILETRATNTGENLDFARALAERSGLRVRRAVLTAKPYMARRALATAALRWPGVDWEFRCFPGGYDGYPCSPDAEAELVHFLVGDLQRLDVYGRRGWSAPVPIPGEVRAAHGRLVALGFTGQLVAERPTGRPRPGHLRT
ncbi:YdcF family protein [Marinactinospora rubrisoli]|uniref:YdcF family protein n=1 Tax=Marinactinospora rubrisoli TaxID=2715399 RepID=A0ABW2KJW7_9ACTN